MESAADPAAPGAERRIFWIAAVVVILLDLITKIVAEAVLLRTPGIAVLGDWFQLRLVYNQGAAFGLHLGPYSRWIFLTSRSWPWSCSGGCPVPASRRLVPQLALGLVAGGAAGNLIDRIRSTRGVVDFLDVGIGALRWPTFNVADIAVSCGAIALVVSMWREDVRQPEPPAARCSRDTTRSDRGGASRRAHHRLLRPHGRHRAARSLSRRPIESLPHPGGPPGRGRRRPGERPSRARQPDARAG
jgi:signal peptidase II